MAIKKSWYPIGTLVISEYLNVCGHVVKYDENNDFVWIKIDDITTRMCPNHGFVEL